MCLQCIGVFLACESSFFTFLLFNTIKKGNPFLSLLLVFYFAISESNVAKCKTTWLKLLTCSALNNVHFILHNTTKLLHAQVMTRAHFNSSKSFLFSVLFLDCDLIPMWAQNSVTVARVFSTSLRKNGYKIILIRAYNLITFCKILAFTRFYNDYKYKHSTSRRSISEVKFPDTSRVRANRGVRNGRFSPVVKVKAIFGETVIGNAYCRQLSPERNICLNQTPNTGKRREKKKEKDENRRGKL